MCGFRGGGGDSGSERPTPLKNHKNIGFSSNTGLDPLTNRSYQASIQCWAIIDIPAKRHGEPMKARFNLFSLHSPTKTKKKRKTLSKLDSLWQTFWIRACGQCEKKNVVEVGRWSPALLYSPSTHQLKRKWESCQSWTPSDKTFWIRACRLCACANQIVHYAGYRPHLCNHLWVNYFNRFPQTFNLSCEICRLLKALKYKAM